MNPELQRLISVYEQWVNQRNKKILENCKCIEDPVFFDVCRCRFQCILCGKLEAASSQRYMLCKNHMKYKAAIHWGLTRCVTMYIPNAYIGSYVEGFVHYALNHHDALNHTRNFKYPTEWKKRSYRDNWVDNSYAVEVMLLFGWEPYVLMYTASKKVIGDVETKWVPLSRMSFFNINQGAPMEAFLNEVMFKEEDIHPASFYLLPKIIQSILKQSICRPFWYHNLSMTLIEQLRPTLIGPKEHGKAITLVELCLQVCWSLNIKVPNYYTNNPIIGCMLKGKFSY